MRHGSGRMGAVMLSRRIVSLFLLFFLCTGFIRGGSNLAPLFTPQWARFGLGAGGQITAVYNYADGTVLARTDTNGFYVYETSNNCVYGATVYSPPCWRQGFTASNVPDFTIDLANGGNGGVEAVACPSNTNVIYAFWGQHTGSVFYLYVSQDRGVSWLKTTLTTTQQPNNGNAGGPYIACDPNDPATAIFDTVTNGVYYTTNGTAGTPTFTNIAALGTGVSHVMAFELGSSSNVMVSRSGTGVYRSTTGVSGTFSLTTSGPATPNHLHADKFGQMWATTNGGSTVYRFASGAWNAHAVGTGVYAIATDPTSSSVGSQRVAAMYFTGEPIVSTNNGTSWTTLSFNVNFNVPAGQPTWLSVANQLGGGVVQLNGYSAAFDGSGNLRFAGGLGVWKAPAPIVGGATTTNYAADTLGIEQLVVNKIVSPAGGPPAAAVWDKGIIRNPNPNNFPTTYWNNSTSVPSIIFGWGLDWASNDPTVLANWGVEATSTNQGSSWTSWTGGPSSTTGPGGGDIAALTSQKYIVVSNTGQPIYVTQNGASTFATSTITGTPTDWVTGPGVGWPLAADRLAANTYCAIRTNQTAYYSTNSGSSFTASGITGANLDGAPNLFFLRSAPGTSDYYYSAGGQGGAHPTNTHFWKLTKTTNPCDTATNVNANLKEVLAFGFGALPPAGGSYATTIYVYGWLNGTLGFYKSTDGASTWSAINVPASETPYPLNSMDLVTWLEGDPDIYGRINIGFRGSGAAYIDTADACPWVSFSNVVANQSLSGTSVSVTAVHSGLVPATGANLYVDGVQVGTTQTGSTSAGTTTYTFTLNATANAGSRTLKVQAAGNGCSFGGTGNSKSIPVTLSYMNDNAPLSNVA